MPVAICNMPEKHLYENRENYQKYTIVKLGCSTNYAGFEANFKRILYKLIS